jgi:hypothetical protein
MQLRGLSEESIKVLTEESRPRFVPKDDFGREGVVVKSELLTSMRGILRGKSIEFGVVENSVGYVFMGGIYMRHLIAVNRPLEVVEVYFEHGLGKRPVRFKIDGGTEVFGYSMTKTRKFRAEWVPWLEDVLVKYDPQV